MTGLLDALATGDLATARAIADGRPISVHEAAALGDPDRLRDVLDRDPLGTSTFSPDGRTALGFASYFGRSEAVALLLSAGADPNLGQLSPGGAFPLHDAVANRFPDVVSLLLAAGADPNEPDGEDWTPLHYAAKNGDDRSVDLLITAGARTGYANRDGHTALDLAELARRPDLAEKIALNAVRD